MTDILISTLLLLVWLIVIVLSSYLLSEGANELAHYLGPVFVGRIVLSIVTTFPEIAIVGSAVNDGYLDAALGASIGSNLLMITLGLSIVAIVATTKLLSKKPVKEFETREFRSDVWFLGGTAVLSLIMLVQGIALISGIIFIVVFAYYAYHAYSEVGESVPVPVGKKPSRTHVAAFMIFGAFGVIYASEFFVHELANVSSGVGISLAVLSLIISPIAGEMPEKISLILLSRKGHTGLRIAMANILGSKVLNNTLLLGIYAILAVVQIGMSVQLVSSGIETFQLILVALVTVVALGIVFRSINRKKALLLTAMYVISIAAQFLAMSY